MRKFLFFIFSVFSLQTTSQVIDDNGIFDHFYVSALHAKQMGNLQSAFNFFQNCFKLRPNSSAVSYELSRLMLLTQNYEYASDYADISIKNDSTNNKYYVISAIYANRMANRQEQNVDLYEKLIKLEPDEIEHYFNYYALLLDIKRPQDALSLLDRIDVTDEADVLDVDIRRVACYQSLGNKRKMMKLLNKLYKKYPTDPRVNSLLGYSYYADKKIDKGLKFAQQATTFPGGDAFLFTLADMYKEQGMDSLYAEVMLKAFNSPEIVVDVKSQKFYELLSSPDNMAKTKSWRPFFENLMQSTRRLYPSDQDLCALRETYYSQNGLIKRGLKELVSFVQFNSGNDYIWRKILVQGQIEIPNDDLIEYAKRAVVDVPNEPIFKILCGQYLYTGKAYQDAIPYLSDALKQLLSLESSPQVNELKSMTLHSLAQCHYSLGNIDDSFKFYDQILSDSPNDPVALNNYAYFLAENKRELEKAEKMSMQSLNQDPLNSTYLDTYAYILMLRSRYNEALFVIERCIENLKSPASFDVLDHYGDILFYNSRIDDAVSQWQKALNLDPNNEVINRKIKNRKIDE